MYHTRPSGACQDSAPTDRYTRLPDALLSELTPRDHQVIHLLLSYQWFADSAIHPYVGTMAARLDVSRRTIQRSLRRLEAQGYLVIVARYRDESEDGEHHGQTSNVYVPGPMLLPLLPPLENRADMPSEPDRRPPMTSTPHKKKTNLKDTKRTDQDYGTKDYTQTRYGTLEPPCARCYSRLHRTQEHGPTPAR